MTSTVPLPAHLEDAVRSETSLRRFLHGLPGVDPVGVEQRAAGLATRSIKKASKLAAIDLAISMVDLTTLEGADTPGKVRNLAARRRGPTRTIPDVPRTSPRCASTRTWWPSRSRRCRQRRRGRLGRNGFPTGRSAWR